MTFAFAPPPQASVPIAGSGLLFPVHRIYCVGRNYNDHVKEMGGVVGRDPPFFFAKPADAVETSGRFPYPAQSQDVHHEIELVVALGPGAEIFGYAVGIDMTRRDLQAEAKRLQRPWETAKGFDHSALLGPVVPIAQCGRLEKGAITLDVNGQRRQSGDLAEMIWPVADIIPELAKYFSLQPGDLIYTGTPAGVGPVKRGDHMQGSIAGLGTIQVAVV